MSPELFLNSYCDLYIGVNRHIHCPASQGRGETYSLAFFLYHRESPNSPQLRVPPQEEKKKIIKVRDGINALHSVNTCLDL